MLTNKPNPRVVAPLLAVGVAAGTIAAYRRVVRPWYLRWGAAEQEVKRALPGDELVPNPHYHYTRAITIDAPVEQVWQWVVQIGQNRGGLYSYEWLENLFGADMHNAERVIPEYQNLKVGDYILLYPQGPAYGVAQADPPHMLVLQTINQNTGDFTESVERDGAHGTWTFVLEPRVDNSTRLIVRARLDYQQTRASAALWHMVEPVNFVMERKMLKGIKERAEAHREPDELLDRVMPEYEFRGVERITIHATPAQIMTAFEQVGLADMPLAQVMGELRYLPGRLTGHNAEPDPDEPFLKLLLESGNLILAQEPDREIVLGVIGKFHQLFDQEFVRVQNAWEFQRFLHADYQKLAMSLRVAGNDPKVGCTLTLEHRTHAMSEHARKQFARYWLAIKPGGGFAAQQLLRAVRARAEALANAASESAPTRQVEMRVAI